jgi:hypothetical protein
VGRVETAQAITLSGFEKCRRRALFIDKRRMDFEDQVRTVEWHFPFVHRISSRKSTKPLILASRICKALPDD